MTDDHLFLVDGSSFMYRAYFVAKRAVKRGGPDLVLAEGGGTFGTYLSRLKTPGLIEEADAGVRAAPHLMGAA